MRILISVMLFAGHVRPIANLTATLIGRGHAVTVYTGNHYRDRFDQLGASVVTWRTAPDFDETDVSATFPETGRPGFRGVLGNFEHIFIRTGAAQARDLAREIDTHTYPVIVGDSLSLGAGLAAEQRNLPWVSIAVMPNTYPGAVPPPGLRLRIGRGWPGRTRDRLLWQAFRVISRRLSAAYRDQRRELGLPLPGPWIGYAWFSPDLILQTGPPSLDHPRTDLPAGFRYIGRLADPAERATVAAPRRDSPPLIMVTQGTYNTDPDDLLAPTFRGLADAPVRLTVTTGRRASTDIGIPVPTNTTVVDYDDFAETLPRTSVVVTNGGWGGVLECAGELARLGGTVRAAELIEEFVTSGAGRA